ncbi:MAG: TPR end-of-group domain-containing protein [Planctomycetota bacterium]
MAPRRSIIGGPDTLLALYYEGGTGGLFDPIGGKPEDEDLAVELCERVLELDPDNVDALGYLGNHFTRTGLYERGLEIVLRLIRLRPESARGHYNLACGYALLERPEDAMRELELAYGCGFGDAEHMKKDDHLTSLRERPDFKKLVRRVRARERRRAKLRAKPD